MKLLYLDCGMGAAGDMLAAALLELFEDKESILRELNDLGIPDVRYNAESSQKCGITGTHLQVLVDGQEEDEHLHDHPHAHLHNIEHIIAHLRISEKVRRDVLAVYDLIAQAESHVHGVPVAQIHFHEVGNMDAVADITAVCYLLDKLGADRIIASPVHVGSGQVRCAHGILPVPAPATAYILKGIPIYGGEIRGELCTPTGAALLKHFVSEFGPMPPMQMEAIGYGMGKKDFSAANCIRSLLGTTQDAADTVIELACNLDDMTGEEMGFAMERLLDAGALDVYTVPIGMKKSRPGIMLCALCRPEDEDKILRTMFRHTTTLGIRKKKIERCTLHRRIETFDTPYGPVRQKIAAGFGVERRKFEYEDLNKIAQEQNIPLGEIKEKLQR